MPAREWSGPSKADSLATISTSPPGWAIDVKCSWSPLWCVPVPEPMIRSDRSPDWLEPATWLEPGTGGWPMSVSRHSEAVGAAAADSEVPMATATAAMTVRTKELFRLMKRVLMLPP